MADDPPTSSLAHPVSSLGQQDRSIEQSALDFARRRELLQEKNRRYFAALRKVGPDYADALWEQMTNGGW